MIEQPLLYELARIFGLPPDERAIKARAQELQAGVLVVQSVAMPERQLRTLVREEARGARDETFSTDEEIAFRLRISLKTWKRLTGPDGDQKLRKLGHLELRTGTGARAHRRYRMIDVLEWDEQRRAAEESARRKG